VPVKRTYKKRYGIRTREIVDEEFKGQIEVPKNMRQTIAAQLLGEDRLPDRQIAEIVGISRRQLAKWKTLPDFKELINTHAKQYISQFTTEGLARKEKRLAVKNDIHDRLLTAIKERGDDPDMEDVPGGTTGLVVKQYKAIGKGKSFRIIEEYKIDTPVVRSILDLHEDVREELGQNKIPQFQPVDAQGQPLQPPQIVVQVVQVQKGSDGRARLVEGEHYDSGNTDGQENGGGDRASEEGSAELGAA
jgi:hypothetical protein